MSGNKTVPFTPHRKDKIRHRALNVRLEKTLFFFEMQRKHSSCTDRLGRILYVARGSTLDARAASYASWNVITRRDWLVLCFGLTSLENYRDGFKEND